MWQWRYDAHGMSRKKSQFESFYTYAYYRPSRFVLIRSNVCSMLVCSSSFRCVKMFYNACHVLRCKIFELCIITHVFVGTSKDRFPCSMSIWTSTAIQRKISPCFCSSCRYRLPKTANSLNRRLIVSCLAISVLNSARRSRGRSSHIIAGLGWKRYPLSAK